MIPSHATSRIGRELGQEKFARSFDAWSHVVCLLYSQLCHSISLADVCDGLALRFSRWCFAATAVTMSVTNMVAEVICAFGNEEQKKKYVSKICSGEYSAGAFGLTESMAGSDPGGMKTTAVREGDQYRINGSKIFITNAPVAEVAVVYAKTEPDKRAKGITAFIIEKGFEGFSVPGKMEKMGKGIRVFSSFF